MFLQKTRLISGVLFVSTMLLAMPAPVMGQLVFNGGSGGISFGVTPYGGAPNVGGPTYIADNITGRNDILTSPGLGTLGGYLTANPVIANNIASYGGALPLFASQVGGGNGNGPFGQGSVANLGPQVSMSLADSGPGGGSASYAIAAGNTTYTVVGAPIPAGATYGAYLTMGGAVPLVGNADVTSLRVHISDTAGIFGAGGTDLPQLVLAISRNGAGAGIGNYNIVTIGGVAGGNAALILDNGVTGAFRSLAVDNQALGAALPVGDILSISYAVTGFADPASFDTFDPLDNPDLLNLTGPLPDQTLVGTPFAAVPEPGTVALMLVPVVGVAAYFVRRRRMQTALNDRLFAR
jgi:hypothetical protein